MRRNKGFTLIELMIAVLVVGILAAIAIPTYTQYVQRANRSAAQQFMLEVASRAEQYRLDVRAYPSGFASEGGDLVISIPGEVSKYYDPSLSATNTATPPTFTVTAAPKAGTTQEGTATLTLDSAGNKTPADAW